MILEDLFNLQDIHNNQDFNYSDLPISIDEMIKNSNDSQLINSQDNYNFSPSFIHNQQDKQVEKNCNFWLK